MSMLERPATTSDWTAILQVIVALVLAGAILALAVIGLDALNELMARGFASMRSPGS